MNYLPNKDRLTRKISRELNEGVFNDVGAIFFSDFLYESICCWNSFKLPRQVEAIQMSTNNICFYKAINKSTRSVI